MPERSDCVASDSCFPVYTDGRPAGYASGWEVYADGDELIVVSLPRVELNELLRGLTERNFSRWLREGGALLNVSAEAAVEKLREAVNVE